MPVPGFLHTSPVHVPMFDALLSQRDPSLRAVHVVDESLLVDARTSGPESVADRIQERLAQLRDQGAERICCSCSSIGEVAEQVAEGGPVFRVDRPMLEQAVAIGGRIGVVAALESTLGPTRSLCEEVARDAGDTVTLSSTTADGAWARFEEGDQPGYLAEIAASAREIAGASDVIVLAQASMADAALHLSDLDVPVLSSPGPAVDRLLLPALPHRAPLSERHGRMWT